MKDETSTIVKAERALERALVVHRMLTLAVHEGRPAQHLAGIVRRHLDDYEEWRKAALHEYAARASA